MSDSCSCSTFPWLKYCNGTSKMSMFHDSHVHCSDDVVGLLIYINDNFTLVYSADDDHMILQDIFSADSISGLVQGNVRQSK